MQKDAMSVEMYGMPYVYVHEAMHAGLWCIGTLLCPL